MEALRSLLMLAARFFRTLLLFGFADVRKLPFLLLEMIAPFEVTLEDGTLHLEFTTTFQTNDVIKLETKSREVKNKMKKLAACNIY